MIYTALVRAVVPYTDFDSLLSDFRRDVGAVLQQHRRGGAPGAAQFPTRRGTVTFILTSNLTQGSPRLQALDTQ